MQLLERSHHSQKRMEEMLSFGRHVVVNCSNKLIFIVLASLSNPFFLFIFCGSAITTVYRGLRQWPEHIRTETFITVSRKKHHSHTTLWWHQIKTAFLLGWLCGRSWNTITDDVRMTSDSQRMCYSIICCIHYRFTNVIQNYIVIISSPWMWSLFGDLQLKFIYMSIHSINITWRI